MAFSHTYGAFAVIGSFNAWFQAHIDDTKPSWWSGAVTVNFDYPRQPLVFPSFSVTTTGQQERAAAQGNLVDVSGGTRLHGVWQDCLFEIGCWVTQTDNANWRRDLLQMRDMVHKLLKGTRSIAINDLYASTASPTATGAIMRVVRIDDAESPTDENPNVERKRILVLVRWLERW